jgi:hypothetical protein
LKTRSNKKPSNFSIQNTSVLSRKPSHDFNETEGVHPHFFSSSGLKFGKTGDSFEKEADSMSEKVVEVSNARNSAETKSNFITPNTFHASAPGSHVQAKPFFPESNADSEIQLKEADNSSADKGDFENRLAKSSGSGQPMDNSTRNDMESGFGANFGNVRIHNSPDAAEMSTSIGARAFTHGQDIYFNKNEYQPGNREGKRLLAHELTHTIQQGSTKTAAIQKADPPPGQNTNSVLKVKKGSYAGSELDLDNKAFKITQLSLPFFKKRNSNKFPQTITLKKGERGETNQVENWKNAVASKVTTSLDLKLKEAKNKGGVTPEGVYFFKAAKHNKFYLFGKTEDLLEKAKVPFWDNSVDARNFQVDHVLEVQISGDANGMPISTFDTKDNYELLDATANMSSGFQLALQTRLRMNEALEALRKENLNDARIPAPKNFYQFKNDYTVSFTKYDFKLHGIAGEPNQYWSLEKILSGDHLKILTPLRGNQLPKMGKENDPLLFASMAGGAPIKIPKKLPKKNWMPRVDLLNWAPTENVEPNTIMGTLTLDVFRAAEGKKRNQGLSVDPSYPNQTWNVIKIDGIYGGSIYDNDVSNSVKNSLRLPGLSQVVLETSSLDPEKGLTAKGKVKTSIPLIDGADITIEIAGNNVIVKKVFNTGDIKVPPPFNIINSSLEVYVKNTDLGGSGEIQFEIAKVGSGLIKADISNEKGFSLEGEFNFDFKQLNPAKIKVYYKNGDWSFEATLGIQQGKIKGVKDAVITVGYMNGSLTANGTVNLNIPKVKNGMLNVSYSKEEGIIIGGTFELDDTVKGIKNSVFSARITRKPGADDFKIAASGTVYADIPGLKNTSITGSYDDGLFSLELKTGYQIGIVSGELHVGVTNEELDDEGKPTGKETEELTFWGGAKLEVVFADMVRGTVEGQVTPIGEVILKGGISLANEIPLTKKAFEIKPKPLFEFPTISIPIGPSLKVLGKKIGIFLEFGGSLNFEAGIGPLTLKGLFLDLEGFNPQKPENVKLTGGASLSLPAYAQLKLVLFAGVSLSVLIVEAWGRLNGSAALILQGEAGGEVKVEWSRETGLKLVEASGHLDAAVKLLLSVFLSAGVEVDLLLTSFTAWSDKWDLASLEIGTPLNFGIDFPVNLENGNVKGIDFNNIELTKPSFDSSSLKNILTGAVDAAQNPPPEPPPSKEKVMKKLRGLEPGYSFDFFGDNSGRWGYIVKLKVKYPEQDWGFAEEEARRIDQSEVEPFKKEIMDLPEDYNKIWLMGKIAGFKDDRPHVDLSPLKPVFKEKGLPMFS